MKGSLTARGAVGRESLTARRADIVGREDQARRSTTRARKKPCRSAPLADGSPCRRLTFPFGSALFFEPELLHPPIQRLAGETQVARGTRDDAAGARERTFDLGAIGFALGQRLAGVRRLGQAQIAWADF